MSGRSPLRGAQVKFRKPGSILDCDEVKNEVTKARDFDLQGVKLGQYSILTTSENDTLLQAEIIRINQDHRLHKLFEVELLTWEAIEEILRDNPGLWDKIVGASLNALVAPMNSQLSTIGHGMTALLTHFGVSKPTEVEDDIDIQLNRIKEYLDNHDYRVALSLLRTLHNGRWGSMAAQQRFLTITYLARGEYDDGNWEEAGRLFVEAETHLPGEERAKTNRALGLELLGERQQAETIAREVLQENPTAVRPWSIICRTAADTVTAESLEQEMPTVARIDDEVLVALAMREARSGRWEDAETFASKAAREDVAWSVPWLLLAQAKLQILCVAAYKPAEGPLSADIIGSIQEVIRVFDKAISLAECAHNVWCIIQSLIERSRAKAILGDEKGAESDLQAAFADAPNDSTAIFHLGQFLLTRNRLGEAIPLLRKAFAIDPSSDCRFILALAIRQQNEDENRSEWIPLAIEAALDRDCTYRIKAIGIALEGLFTEKRNDEAAAFLEKLEAAQLPSALILACKAWLTNANLDHTRAVQLAKEAVAAIDGAVAVQCLRFIAEVLLELSEYQLALPVWEKVAGTTHEIPDAWQLVDVAKRVNRDDLIRRTADEWRKSGIRDNRLIEEELAVLEKYEPLRAIERLEEEIALRPNDAHLRLRLSTVGVRLNRPDLVCRNVEQFPAPSKITPHNGAIVISILARIVKFESALRYAYELLHHHPRNPQIQQVFAWLLLNHDDEEAEQILQPPQTADIGVAIKIIDGADNQPRWIVIEDETQGHHFDDEIAPSHPLAVH